MPADLNYGYSFRTAMPQDAAKIAAHRAMMFRDMGCLSEAETQLLRDASEGWIAELIADGSYRGWMVHHDDVVVGGGGMHLRAHGPVPSSFEAGVAAHIANVYIELPHRRRGLAEALMTEMIQWAKSHKVKELTLTASEQGRQLYRRLGFSPNTEFHTMKL